MKRFGKIVLRLFLFVVIAIVAMAGATGVLLASPKGLPWLVAAVAKLVPGFTTRQVSGRFFSSWSLLDISYQNKDFSVAVDNLRLRWHGKELSRGLLAIDELAVTGIRLELPAGAQDTGRSPSRKETSDKTSELAIPSWLRLRLDKLTITDAQFTSAGCQVLALENVSGSGEIGSGSISLKDWHLAGQATTGASAGQLGTTEAIRFALNLDGSVGGSIGSPEQATTQPGASIAVSSQINLWPGRGFAPVTGVLTAHGTLAKPELVLQLSAPAPLTMTAGGERADNHWRWHGELSGQAISLTAISASLRPAQISLVAKASGLDAQYEATATGTATVPGKGNGRLALALAGDASQLTLQECRIDGAFGILRAKGGVAWTNGLAWRGEIETNRFNPAFFAPDYTGALNTALSTSGTVADNSRVGSLSIDKLSGQLRGYPVSGGGGLHFTDDSLSIESLWLQSGKARLDVAGNIAEQIDITADIAIPNLSEVLAAASGSLEAKAAMTGVLAAPRLEARLKGRGLSFGGPFGGQTDRHSGLGLGLVNADFTGVWTKEKPADSSFSGHLQAEHLSKNNQALADSLKLSLDGSLAKHQAGLSVNGPLGEAALHLAGGIKEKSWQGAIDSVTLTSAHTGRWRQNGTAPLALAADKGELTGLSLSGGEGSFRLAGGFTGKGAERLWRFGISDGKLPLSLMPKVDGKPATGSVTFALNAEGTGARLTAGQLSARTNQADVPGIPVVPGLHRFHLEETGLDAELKGGTLALDMKSRFNNDNAFLTNLALTAPNGVFDLGNLLALSQAPLAGTLRLNLGNINFVAPLSHYTVIPSGPAAGNFAVSGTPLDPRLTGKVTMPDDGHVEITSSGMDIKDVAIDAVISADVAGLLGAHPPNGQGRAGGGDGLILDLTVHGSSGPGRATAVGVLKFPLAGPFSGDFSMTGNDFEIFHRPEYHIRGNPEVRMFFDRHHGKLSGTIPVTWAEIAPEHFQSSVSASDDLIIADGEEDSGWLFLTDLHILLSDQVHFTGYGLTGLLHGDLTIKTNESGHFMGQGSLQLADGGFIIYGRRLQIERGRLSFAGGAIDDPLIDARAQKQVLTTGSGVHEITVGVDVSGSAHEPEFQLFSSEPLGDREILTYLLSGTSASKNAPDESLISSAAKALGLDDQANLLGGMGLFDEVSLERNETDNSMSLLVGKRLTDDLFIGYDQNFVGEGGGAFKIRYNLGHGFTTETSSSGSVSSADLFYSFEK
ncbi:MAG: translocation/assembly module TamB domain-containing protein [Desulfobulbaceae bacterium]|jgi:translocation and assembly module TamB|nr:translocation/assembly module TamB domain-containing protein [Desulfobulbaceae bacterium]